MDVIIIYYILFNTAYLQSLQIQLIAANLSIIVTTILFKHVLSSVTFLAQFLCVRIQKYIQTFNPS